MLLRVLSFCVVTLGLLWFPYAVSFLLVAAYAWRWNGIELVLVTIVIDWFLVPAVPVLTLGTATIVVLLPTVRRLLMLYT